MTSGTGTGSGAHLVEIVRTAVGEFTLDHASTLDELQDAAKSARFDERVIRLEAAAIGVASCDRVADRRAARQPWCEIQCHGVSNPARPDYRAAGSARFSRFRRLATRATESLQPTAAIDRDRRSCCPAHVPADPRPRRKAVTITNDS
jgi:hypothetical protein